MQLVQPSKFFSVTIFRTRSRANWGYVAIFSNTENFRCLYSDYGSCMPSSPKEYLSPCYSPVDPEKYLLCSHKIFFFWGGGGGGGRSW